MRTACEDGNRSPGPRKDQLSCRARSAAGQNLTEYALVIAVIAVLSVVSINFLRESFRTLYMAHQAPLNEPVTVLAMTATPEESAEEDVTPEPTATATRTPIPTPTATVTPTATPTPELEPLLPDCDSQPWWYWWWNNLDCE